MKYGLSEKQLSEIVTFISPYSEIEEAVLFGSRAIDTYKEASDVDIALKGDRVTASLAAKLKFEIEEDTYLPFFFDFVAYPTITNEALKGHIDTQGIVIYRKGWRECRLGEVAEIYDGPHATPSKTESGVIFLGISNLNKGRIDTSQFEYVSEEDFVKWTKRITPRENDILFSYETRLGEVAIVPQGFRCCLGRRMGLLRPKFDIVDPKFLLYYYIGPLFQAVIRERTVFGTTVDRLPLVDMPKFPIFLPQLSEQKAIASVLSSLDNKIDLLYRQNKTLEAMAETLFRQWFVEKADEGWEEKIITELFEIRDGTHDSPKPNQTGKHLVTSKHILENKLDFETANLISDGDFENINKRSKVDTNDILFSMIGTLGLIHLEQSTEINYAIKNIGLFKTSQNPKWIYYTFLWLKSSLGQDFIHEYRSGSTQEYISLGSLRSIVFNVPSKDILESFNAIVGPLFDRKQNNCKQIQTLEKLRDTLLPKLMSGELRVELEEIV